MDGTILNSEDVAHEMYTVVCSQFGKVFTEQLHRDIMGTKSDYWSRYLVETLDMNVDPEVFKSICGKLEYEMLQNNLRLVDGFSTLVDTVRLTGTKLILVTSSKRDSVVRNLGFLGIENPFDDWVTADEVQNGKPDPEPFLLGAKQAGVFPEECISIEDSVYGVDSAASAGTTVFAVPGQYSLGSDFSRAAKVFKSLRDCVLDIENTLRRSDR